MSVLITMEKNKEAWRLTMATHFRNGVWEGLAGEVAFEQSPE